MTHPFTQSASALHSAQAAEMDLLLHTYDRNPILLTRGEGVFLYDDAGTEYLDMLSGIGVCALGYNHPAITAAITAQASKLLHTSNLFFHEGTVPLAEKLTAITGMDRVFFCNSGTEAWEAALKLARAHSTRMRGEGRTMGTKMIALEHGFHGRTMGSLATTHKEKYREPFAPLMPGVLFVPFNDVEALRAAFSGEVCAICIEAVQGEGGIHPVSQEFFAAARELCDSTGALLIADEIQSGMGRTGRWCAYQHYGIQPDVTTLAKPLAGGLPVGAMLCTHAAAHAIVPGQHGTTFGGNPLACAVSIAVLEEIESSHLLDHVSSTAEYFFQQLHQLAADSPAITDVRGLGLMIGVELSRADLAEAVVKRMIFDEHILLNRTGETVLRFLPPFLIGRDHVDRVVAALDRSLHALTRRETGAQASTEEVLTHG